MGVRQLITAQVEEENPTKSLVDLENLKISMDPPAQVINQLIKLFEREQYIVLIERSFALTKQFPNSFLLWNILGFANQNLGRNKGSEISFRNVTRVHPDYPEGYLNLGIALKNQGKLEEAIDIYEKVIKKAPDFVDAYNSKGNVLKDQGKIDEAINAYDKALSLDPDFAEAHNNMGNVLQDQGKHEDAIEAYGKALSLKPDFALAYSNMGNAFLALGMLEDAIEQYDKAIHLRPNFAYAYNGKANVLKKQGKLEEALEQFDKAIHHKPNYADFYNGMGNVLFALGRLKKSIRVYHKAVLLKPDFSEAHNNMGNAFFGLGMVKEAIGHYNKALQLRPDFVDAYNNIGNAYHNQGNWDKAIRKYHKALSLRPDSVDAYNNMGNTFYMQNKLDEAIKVYNKAILLKPDYIDGYNNIGLTFLEQGKLEAAGEAFEKVLSLEKNNAKALFNLALLYNVQGNLKLGFELYEWRTKVKENHVRPARKECSWDGCQSINGKHIFVYEEQGLGDVIQFCRYLSLLEERGAIVSFEVRPKLQKLLSSLAGEIVFTKKLPSPSKTDFEIPLMSLPHFFGTELETIPVLNPYLYAEKTRTKLWAEKFDKNTFKVGICWQGNKGKADIGRSFPLTLFKKISKLSHVELVSLNKGYGEEQLRGINFEVTTCGSEFDSGNDAFVDTAAVMMVCDLIITSDTAVAHLAGALGQPTWVALKHQPEWRWLLGRHDSPWYPTVSLYRQEVAGDWVGVFKRMEQDLLNLLAKLEK